MPAELTAVLIDDHQLVLEGLSRALAREGLRVVGSFVAAPEALGYLSEHPVDFAVVDLRLGGDSGIRVVGEIRRLSPKTRVAVLTSYDDRVAAAAAIRSGATGFLLKTTLSSDLGRQLREVAEGNLVVDARVAAAVFEPSDLLGGTEVTVLRLVAEGLTNREIGQRMHLSHYTIKDHLTKAMRKLGTGTRAETVAKAVQQGLLRQV
ncbi:response regulator transcription factor [Amycolatopsis acidicola]|uniref:Response regulator transcription factor n=1 Tax=Amycolatopsis acidicola TaxID=2596893 RepID=A0A5N0VHX3_9PSEU|nr:response regulator transcription factor [Amycolatopsis acidicola]KAA9165977.1 response regulator transcription factor [Amycolatopsis acidicola]